MNGFVLSGISPVSDLVATAAHSASNGSFGLSAFPVCELKVPELREMVPEFVPIPELLFDAILFWEPCNVADMSSAEIIPVCPGLKSNIPFRCDIRPCVLVKKLSDPREWALRWASGGVLRGVGLREGLVVVDVLATIVPSHWSGFGRLFVLLKFTVDDSLDESHELLELSVFHCDTGPVWNE